MRNINWLLVSSLGLGLAFVGNANAQEIAASSAAAAPLATPAKAPVDPSALPTIKDLIAKNDEAMGGSQAWSKVSTRRLKGIYQTEDASAFLGIEVFQKSPDKSLRRVTLPSGAVIRELCDGHDAWIEDVRGGYHPYEGAALEARLRMAQYEDRGKALLLVATGKVTGIQQIGAHKTYVVEFVAMKNLVSRIYFDADTGYLVHTEDVFTTPDGPYTVKLDLDDYRSVDGLKFPFRMKVSEKGAIMTIRLTQVTVNAPIDDSLFLKPESAPK
jgi:hypothetical protein